MYRGLAHLRQAEDKWMELNEACRGGSGDDAKTLAACDAREKLGADLKEVGFCYGEHPEKAQDHIIPSGWEACAS
ncbi:MAG: hypothetical protein JWP28_920 [Phenylobacterium sp.]|nr:hypothetical protein [Phenylobacterium sp.]